MRNKMGNILCTWISTWLVSLSSCVWSIKERSYTWRLTHTCDLLTENDINHRIQNTNTLKHQHSFRLCCFFRQKVSITLVLQNCTVCIKTTDSQKDPMQCLPNLKVENWQQRHRRKTCQGANTLVNFSSGMCYFVVEKSTSKTVPSKWITLLVAYWC